MRRNEIVDCDALQKVKGVVLSLDGLALKTINNALLNYRDFEPETCELCTSSIDELLSIVNAALEHVIEHTKGENNGGN
jgi:hypothetical protein